MSENNRLRTNGMAILQMNGRIYLIRHRESSSSTLLQSRLFKICYPYRVRTVRNTEGRIDAPLFGMFITHCFSSVLLREFPNDQQGILPR
ncbi:hypothetical protein AVEN_100999-1 [Araneus ventricosus]|uniref:Uncharacterized protein n=1 Tax=Araneus ventricosus TaxID=182803 RepID=A0A4Y2P926_ARAVE|nr:hypothetical protein AVEN_100999-1 [Araneus ventricosus]